MARKVVVLSVNKARAAAKVSLVDKAKKVCKGSLDRDRWVNKEKWAAKVFRVHKDALDSKGAWVTKVELAHKDTAARKGVLVLKDLLANRVA